MTNDMSKSVAVVGLGKLGLPLACILASKGFHVVGVDASPATVEAVKSGRYIGPEPRVAELLAANRTRIEASVDYGILARTSLAFVVVPTPSDRDDRFSLECVLPAVRSIADTVARCGLTDYVIVLVSTVMPGACQNDIVPAIREVAGASAIELVYSPEFVALGEVVCGMLSPDLVLIGSNSSHSADRVEQVQKTVVDNDPRIVRTSWASAEIAKLGLNTLVSAKITSANLLAQLCQRTPDANVDDVTAAIGADRRAEIARSTPDSTQRGRALLSHFRPRAPLCGAARQHVQ